MSEPISEADLQAYIDDQLEPTRRIEVEGHLALHAEEAAQVMDGLRVRNENPLLPGRWGWRGAAACG